MVSQMLASLLSSPRNISTKERPFLEWSSGTTNDKQQSYDTFTLEFNGDAPFVRRIWSDRSSAYTHSFCGKLTLREDAKYLMDQNRNRLFTVKRFSHGRNCSLLATDNRSGHLYLFSKARGLSKMLVSDVYVRKFFNTEEFENFLSKDMTPLHPLRNMSRIRYSHKSRKEAKIMFPSIENPAAFIDLHRSHTKGFLSVSLMVMSSADNDVALLLALCRDELCTLYKR